MTPFYNVLFYNEFFFQYNEDFAKINFTRKDNLCMKLCSFTYLVFL